MDAEPADLTLRIVIDDGDDDTPTTKRPRPPEDPPLESPLPTATASSGGDEDDGGGDEAGRDRARSPLQLPPPKQTTNTRPSKRIALRLQREAVMQDQEPPSEQQQQRQQQQQQEPDQQPQPPPKRPKRAPARPSSMPVSGPALAARLAELRRAASSPDAAWPPGTAVWVRVAGFTHPWPGCVWSLDLCRRQEVPAILSSAPKPSAAPSASSPPPPPPLLIRWYGEHSSSWVAPRDVVGPLARGTPEYARRVARLRAFGRRNGCGKLAEPALREADGALAGGGGDVGGGGSNREEGEARRVRELGYARALALQTKKKKGGKKRPPPPRSKKRLYARWRAEQAQRKAREQEQAALARGGGNNKGNNGGCWLLSAAERAAGVGSAWAVCPRCGDDATDLLCGVCGRAQHALCAQPPILGRAYVRGEDRWACASCGAENAGLGSAAATAVTADAGAAADAAAPAAAAPPVVAAAAAANDDDGGPGVVLEGDDDDKEGPAAGDDKEGAPAPAPAPVVASAASTAADARMGLTPAWLISTIAYKVFELSPPTVDRPYIEGLMDPCANDKASPSIPAEVCYDRHDDGLAPRNSWQRVPFAYANPPFCSTVQWRFVNRCSNEIENSGGGGGEEAEVGAAAAAASASSSTSPPQKTNRRLRAIALLCRNSTDTGFFQRLRCFPRVFFRRNAVQFTDYTKNPIGFGICCFLLVPLNAPSTPGLIERFYRHLSPFGEPAVAVDAELVRSLAFSQLLGRLKRETERDHRDHWAQCAECARWRVVDHGTAAALRQAGTSARWTCSALLRPGTRAASCRTPLTRAEAALLAGPGPDGGDRQGLAAAAAAAAAGNNMGGYDWRRKIVVRNVVAAVFAAVRRRHGEGKERAAAGGARDGSDDDDDSDADVPLLELQQRAQRLEQEREVATRERERQELLEHLRPGMPAARLLGPLAAGAAAVTAERRTSGEEKGEAEAGPGGAAAERAQRLADLYLAASLAARKLAGDASAAARQQGAGVAIPFSDDQQQQQQQDVDAVARALLPGCPPVAACRAALAPPGPLPVPPPALVRQRGQVLARLAAAYLCRAHASLFSTNDGARAALRAALLGEGGNGDRQSAAAAVDALKLLAPWLLTPRPAPSAADARAARERDLLGAPALVLLRPLQGPEAASSAAGREVWPFLEQVHAAAARALQPSAAALVGEEEEDEEERPEDEDDHAAVASRPPPRLPPPPAPLNDDDAARAHPPGDLVRLLAERAVLTAPDASCRRVLLGAPDLLLAVAGLWRQEAAFAERVAAAQAARQRSEARRAIGACLLSVPAATTAALPPQRPPLFAPLLRADLARLPSAAAGVACPSTLESCTALPEGVARAFDAAELRRERAGQQRALAARLRGEGEAAAAAGGSSEEEEDGYDGNDGGAIERACARVVEPLDLARYARSAATEALLSGLGLRPSAMAAGLVPAVAPGDPLVCLAARRLAASCARERCARRADRARRELEAKETARVRVLRRCRDELRAAAGAEERARDALLRAEGALAAVVAEAREREREGLDREREAATAAAAGAVGDN